MAMSTDRKSIHFIGGMPRAGSTLLANILAQNPRFHVTPTSGLIDALLELRNKFNQLPDFKAAPNEAGMMASVRGALYGFFDPVDRPVCFDRNRAWLSELEMAEVLLERPAKVIVCVRDIPEILASLEKLWRDNKAFRRIQQQELHVVEFQSLEGRCNIWLQPAHLVGLSYIRITDALTRGFRDRMHFIHFDRLTQNPAAALQDIYRFLGETPFQHDFENVEQVTFENDLFHGIDGLHDIRSAVRPIPSRAKEVLGELVEKFKGPYIWDEHLAKG
jgi:sulfotransferase